MAKVIIGQEDVIMAALYALFSRGHCLLVGVPGLAKTLLGKIASARVSGRLTDSPAVLVAGEFGVSLRMGRILKQAGQNNPFATLPILELNPKHPLVERLRERTRRSGHLRAAGQQAHRGRAGGRSENNLELSMLNIGARLHSRIRTPTPHRAVPATRIASSSFCADHPWWM